MTSRRTTETGITIEYLTQSFDGEKLQISYRVSNESGKKIYLFTPLTKFSNDGPISDIERAYTFLDPEGVLQITKRLWPIPEDADLYMPEVPHMTELLPEHYLEETFISPIPVQIDYPYQKLDNYHNDDCKIEMESNAIAVSISYIDEDHLEAYSKGSASEKFCAIECIYDVAIRDQIFLCGKSIKIRTRLQGN